MTQLEYLAAKIRGAETNADAARIIKTWFNDNTKHAKNLANESAKILQDAAAKFEDTPYAGLLTHCASNFTSIAGILELSNKEMEL